MKLSLFGGPAQNTTKVLLCHRRVDMTGTSKIRFYVEKESAILYLSFIREHHKLQPTYFTLWETNIINYGKSPFLMGKLSINGHFQ